MMLPHMLALFIVVPLFAASILTAASTKWETAGHLTDYYSFRVIELMVMRQVARAPSFSPVHLATSAGTATAALLEETDEQFVVRVIISDKSGGLQVDYTFNKETGDVIKRMENA